jgi:SAM-dependent methyltransferase
MRTDRASLLSRAVGKGRRLSRRFRERVTNVPIRVTNRGLPLPPSRLIYLVAGTNDLTWFLNSGAQAASSIRDALTRNGYDINRMGAILDFGCGAGRTIRHWNGLTETKVCGTDYNPQLVNWCRKSLDFADIRLNGLTGRVDWPDATFDLAYALSVFTHLTEPVGFAWIDEMTRVLKPGGLLLITTHGDHYASSLPDAERARYDAGEAVVRLPGREGTNHCATFHPPRYVSERLIRGLEVVDHVPEGALGNPRQDLWLLRKPGRS